MSKVRELKTPDKPKLDDVAGWERAVYSLGGVAPRYNPDTLVGRQGLHVYKRMLIDEQVKAVVSFKRAAIMGRGWSLSYEDGSPLDETERELRIQVMTKALNNMTGQFDSGLKKIATARQFGFSMTEKVTTEFDLDGRTYVGLSKLLTREQRTFLFYTNEYGLLDRCAQQVGGKEQTVDMSRFVHFVHSPEVDEYYGESDLRAAYRSWYLKERIGDYWALYLEKFAGGFMVVTQEGDTSQPLIPGSPLWNSITGVLNNLHGASGIILPKGLKAELHFPPAQGDFKEAITHHDLGIAKAMLVPNLLGLSHSDGGASLGEGGKSDTQLEAFGWTINEEAQALATCVGEQIIYPLGRANWGDNEYPCFKFKPPSIEHLKWVIETWVKLVGASTVINTEGDETYLRSLLGMPKRDPDAEPLIDPVEQAKQDMLEKQHGLAQDGQEFDQTLKSRQQREAERAARAGEKTTAQTAKARYKASRDPVDIMEAMIREIAEREGLEVDEASFTRMRSYMNERVPVARQTERQQPVAIPHGELRGCTLAQFASASERVAFSVIEQRQTAEEHRMTDLMSAQVARAVARLIGNNDLLATLTDNNVEDVAAVEFSSSEKARLNSTARQGLRAGWDLGLNMARTEIDRARGSARRVFTDLRDRAGAYFEARAFRMAGDLSDQVRNVIQNELLQSVKSGRSPEDTREAIWWRMVDKGFTTRSYVRQNESDEDVQRALDRLWADTEEQAKSYLDTLARTTIYEAMNEARFAEFTDPALGDFVKAMAYSAVLDDRTTEICAELNGDVFLSDSPLWDTFRPPNHFNCRSILVPITAEDDWDGQESERPDTEPAPGFGRGEK